MSTTTKVLIGVFSLALSLVIGLTDAVTGLTPDITILYLIPIALSTIYIGVRFGVAVSVVAAIGEFVFNLQLGISHGARLTIDVILHFLVFTLVVLLLGQLLNQLRTVQELETRRSYDLSIAREIHKSVFVDFPEHFNDLTIASKVVFARELGGDYYYAAGVRDKLFFCIADISGKSISAALFSALLHRNVVEALERTDDLSELVDRINNGIYPALPESMFITLFCCLFEDQRIRFVNAGHEPPLLYSKAQNSIKLLQSKTTLPIGIDADIIIEESTEQFSSGDIFLAVTDGVTDSPYFRDNPYEKLRSLLIEKRDESPDGIVQQLYDRAVPSYGEAQFDDIVIACVKRV